MRNNDTTVVIDGEEYDRIPWGADSRYDTYDEHIQMKKEEIENGGRGNLSVEKVEEELEQFKERWDDPEAYNNRNCPACDRSVGEVHGICDFEECPKCGDQISFCACNIEEFTN